MAYFEPAFEDVMTWEGGYSSDPSDPGGETKFGISKREFPDLDIANLTAEQAKTIYRQRYWEFDGIEDQAVANKLMNLAVNCGVQRCIRILQKALFACGHPVMVDGMFGSATLYAANAIPPDELLAKIKSAAVEHYQKIAAANPTLEKFLHGWLRRAEA